MKKNKPLPPHQPSLRERFPYLGRIEPLEDPPPMYYYDETGGIHPYSDIIVYKLIKKLNEVIDAINQPIPED